MADLLFLGGGLTAASLVAGEVLREKSPVIEQPSEQLTRCETVAEPPKRRSTPGYENESGIVDCDSTFVRGEITDRDPFAKDGEKYEPNVVGRLRPASVQKNYDPKPINPVYGGVQLPRVE
ncbi:MAG: hypothetical protein KC800_27440 [Candidatus Eremiobacteraeota bacterium]|nr:hypothetical protein [Candidatus Eremiobacteraeota bacterium]